MSKILFWNELNQKIYFQLITCIPLKTKKKKHETNVSKNMSIIYYNLTYFIYFFFYHVMFGMRFDFISFDFLLRYTEKKEKKIDIKNMYNLTERSMSRDEIRR